MIELKEKEIDENPDDESSLEKMLFQEANLDEVDCMEDIIKRFCVK